MPVFLSDILLPQDPDAALEAATKQYVDAAGGAVILSGTTAPTALVGEPGDYYLDTVAQILYGPRGLTGYSAAISTYTSQTPLTVVTPGTNTCLGNDVTFAVDGRITALRFYRDTTSTQSSHTINVWNTIAPNGLLATAATSGDSGTGWKTATLATPLDVAAGQVVRLSLDFVVVGDAYARTTFPVADVTNGALSISGTVGSWTGAAAGIYPTSTGSRLYFVDVVFEAISASNPWSIALQGDSATAYSADLPAGTTAVVTHNLGTKDVDVSVYKISDGLEVDVPFSRTSTTAITLNSAVDLAGHRVVVLAAGGAGVAPPEFHIGTTAPSDTSLIWIDTS